MIATITTILVAGLVAMIVVIAHELTEHEPTVDHRGADEEWVAQLRAMQRPRTSRAKSERMTSERVNR